MEMRTLLGPESTAPLADLATAIAQHITALPGDDALKPIATILALMKIAADADPDQRHLIAIGLMKAAHDVDPQHVTLRTGTR